MFRETKQCGICDKPFGFATGGRPCFDHDHLTGRFRQAAHWDCNVKLQQVTRIGSNHFY